MSTAARTGHPGIVTPEAVRLEFDMAGVGSRCAAMLLDLLVVGATLYALNFGLVLLLAAGDGVVPDWLGISLALLFNLGVLLGYPIALETLWRGHTLGKAALGLRVVTVEGAPVRFRHAAIRSALGLVDFWATAGAAAVLATLLTRHHQRLGDLVAGTIVLRERTGAPAPSPARFTVPAAAEGYAATIDPSGLSRDDYATLRSFLLRAGTLPPSPRRRIALRLADGLAARVGHRPPPGTDPELFLLCLAARRQQRGAAGAAAGSAPADRPPAGGSVEPPAVPPPPGDFAPPG